MKQIASILSIIFFVFSMDVAVAGRRHNYHNGHHNHDEYRHDDYYRNDRYSDHYSHRNHRHNRHRNNNGNSAAYIIGGLILGGLLVATLNNSNNRQSQRSNYNKPIGINPHQFNNTAQSSYLTQGDGLCYRVSHVENGKPVMLPANAGNCR